jgi:hypothetical protein
MKRIVMILMDRSTRRKRRRRREEGELTFESIDASLRCD